MIICDIKGATSRPMILQHQHNITYNAKQTSLQWAVETLDKIHFTLSV